MDRYALAVLRIGAGFLFFCHGAQKLFGMFGGMGGQGASAPLMSLLGAAGVIETFGGLLIMVGLLTPYVAVLTAAEMVFAYSMAHFPRGPWPIQNAGEPAVLYFLIFLVLATRGAGPWSVDAARGTAHKR